MIINVGEILRFIEQDLLATNNQLLRDEDRVASGRTLRAMRTTSTVRAGSISGFVVGPDHAQFMLYGRGPGGVPEGVIARWMPTRSLSGPEDSIRAAIAKRGTRFQGFDYERKLTDLLIPLLEQRFDNADTLNTILADFTGQIQLIYRQRRT